MNVEKPTNGLSIIKPSDWLSYQGSISDTSSSEKRQF